MYKMKIKSQIYKVKKNDGLTPSDENKLVDLSHGELVYEREYDYDEGQAVSIATTDQIKFKHDNPLEDGYEYIPLFISTMVKEEEND